MGSAHTVKVCAECKAEKPVGEFYTSNRSNFRRDAYCKECRRKRDRARAKQKARRRHDPEQRRDYKFRQLYGITLADYNAMVKRQDNACGICRSVEKRSMYGERPRLVVDHNHLTGRVRRLLCCTCNTRLSAIEDEQFMLLARRYLRETDGTKFVNDQPRRKQAEVQRAVDAQGELPL